MTPQEMLAALLEKNEFFWGVIHGATCYHDLAETPGPMTSTQIEAEIHDTLCCPLQGLVDASGLELPPVEYRVAFLLGQIAASYVSPQHTAATQEGQ